MVAPRGGMTAEFVLAESSVTHRRIVMDSWRSQPQLNLARNRGPFAAVVVGSPASGPHATR